MDFGWVIHDTQHFLNRTATAIETLIESDYLERFLGPSATRLVARFFGNDYLSAGLFLVICGSLVSPSQAFFHEFYLYLWKTITVSIVIEEKDEAYHALEEFLADHPYSGRIRNLVVRSIWERDHDPDPAKGSGVYGGSPAGRERPRLLYAPGYTPHVYYHRGRKLRVQRIRQETVNPIGAGHMFGPGAVQPGRTTNHQIVLWMVSWDSSFLKGMIAEAVEQYYQRHNGKVGTGDEQRWQWDAVFSRP
ncbi:hypothetical protein BC938DRAFT_475844 [Jimgerdemannia flammicorona]|uniref:BCS1 N-terminal domain-containing protein n=1 Tax=Jimgerdemannia flammicorona TaxID=994334 RepID=A0A433QZ92_9FUNG|nr:hypothetical protein BC938DRAFT_475844 [Jimgerdemannia flammicorona]